MEIGNDGEVQWAAYLLQLDPGKLKALLTSKTIVCPPLMPQSPQAQAGAWLRR